MVPTKRERALNRVARLREGISDFLEVRTTIRTGFDVVDETLVRRQRILEALGGTEKEWNDWRWQLANRVRDIDTLVKLIDLEARDLGEIDRVSRKYRWAVSPYYLSLIDFSDRFSPVRLQSIPLIAELHVRGGVDDPMDEEYTNPAGAITRRYPDRLTIYASNMCPTYCRHCQRRRLIGQRDRHTTWRKLEESIEYIRDCSEIRDVLITGGDPLTRTDSDLERLVSSIRSIGHVEIIRIGTRAPVTMPQRVTPGLARTLARYQPVYVNTQFNHPLEITPESAEACRLLADAGIPLGNQMVLLNGINDRCSVVKVLNQELLRIRVKPYYIFHAKEVKGTRHFVTSVDKGIEIMEFLRGYTSGLAIPTYVINAPHGHGKTPIYPNYVLSRGPDFITIRTWENRVFRYPNRREVDIRQF
ncbi:KamA family radical SAM protein [Candidatus Fermentibacterales bacterium]|nr:KamA family radical SAM protein [Candidatus Fermentibacterales bacterium]